VAFGKDMGAIAALEDNQSTMTAIDYISLVTIEIEKYMFDPLRAIKFWRSVSSPLSGSLPLPIFDQFRILILDDILMTYLSPTWGAIVQVDIEYDNLSSF
jgi:hypothetical protein